MNQLALFSNNSLSFIQKGNDEIDSGQQFILNVPLLIRIKFACIEKESLFIQITVSSIETGASFMNKGGAFIKKRLPLIKNAQCFSKMPYSVYKKFIYRSKNLPKNAPA